ncbi:MAG: V-type ATP synthase subunit I [Candidatus Micrarchaeota archaeon]|nr:V-type ATP synthase subunit I [Candidatus Micrarchaeota archaeon]
MMRPVKMTKIRAICLKTHAAQVIKALHDLSAVHITDSHLPELERAGPSASYDEISSRLVRIRSLIELLPKAAKQQKKKQAVESPLSEADALIEDAETAYNAIRERDEAARALEANLASQNALAGLEGLEIDFSKLSSPTLRFFMLRTPANKAAIAKQALESAKNCAFAFSQGKASTIFLIAIKSSSSHKQIEELGQVMPLPQISSTPKAELVSLAEKEAGIRAKQEQCAKRLQKFSDSKYSSLLSVEEALSIEADRAKIVALFGASQLLYFIEGWIEASKYPHLQSELNSKFGKKVFLSQAGVSHEETPPTLLDNPPAVKPFEYLVEFISTPQYSEIDPSLILMFTVPLMYALIMGDAGYAFLSFLLAFAIVKKSEKGSLLNQVALIWAISAVPAFIMGIIFNEYFGFTHTHLLGLFGFTNVVLYEGVHRVSSITMLMLLSIMVGMAHIALGFIIGAINEWHHSRKHAIAKLCWLGIQLSGFMMIASFMYNIMPWLGMPSVAVFAISLVGLVMTEGILSAVEIPGLVSNVMSYLRIAAVGVGGVILAEAINELLMPKLELTPVGILMFIVIAALYVLAHLASCVLAMFESLIHGARLNVVEFFGKFYKGNGSKFSPFTARRIYTHEV